MVSSSPTGRAASLRLTVVSIALVTLGQLAFVAIDWSLFGAWPMPPIRGAHVLLGAATLAFIGARRRQLSPRAIKTAYLAVVLPLLLVFWIGEVVYLHSGRSFAPFFGTKLAMLLVALLAPTLRIGTFLLIGFAVETVPLWYLYNMGSSAHVSASEPWATMSFGALSLVMLLFRAHHDRVARAAEEERVRAQALEELAKVLLAIRDIANTPIQTLGAAVELLRIHGDGDPVVLDAMERALARLRLCTRPLAGYDEHVRWERIGGSLDVEQAIRTLRESDLRGADTK
jgi:hypothetical protein